MCRQSKQCGQASGEEKTILPVRRREETTGKLKPISLVCIVVYDYLVQVNGLLPLPRGHPEKVGELLCDVVNLEPYKPHGVFRLELL